MLCYSQMSPSLQYITVPACKANLTLLMVLLIDRKNINRSNLDSSFPLLNIQIHMKSRSAYLLHNLHDYIQVSLGFDVL